MQCSYNLEFLQDNTTRPTLETTLPPFFMGPFGALWGSVSAKKWVSRSIVENIEIEVIVHYKCRKVENC